ncbi:MAG: DUF4410 domain-containing protein [Prosthecobacter sp.]|nr:DUF4410 domain-containing protein [Prosthecobacter sp.]
MRNLRTLLIIAAATSLVSCGTVSTVQPAAASNLKTGKQYSKVVVQDFRSAVSDDDGSTVVAGRQFADVIAQAVRSSRPGVMVSRNGPPDAGTLVIGGEITRYMEGNAALRLFIGMGAGSSYFDANIRFSDGATGQSLGSLRADKNSWGLGGSIAATQTVKVFMQEAAKKTATEVAPLLR